MTNDEYAQMYNENMAKRSTIHQYIIVETTNDLNKQQQHQIYKCIYTMTTICTYTSDNPTDIAQHIEEHLQIQNICPACRKKFKTDDLLNDHIVVDHYGTQNVSNKRQMIKQFSPSEFRVMPFESKYLLSTDKIAQFIVIPWVDENGIIRNCSLGKYAQFIASTINKYCPSDRLPKTDEFEHIHICSITMRTNQEKGQQQNHHHHKQYQRKRKRNPANL